MIIFMIVLFVIFVYAIYAQCQDEFAMIPGLIAAFSGVFLLIIFLFLIITPIKVKGSIAEYYAVRDSISMARKMGGIERAALTQKIIETNKWLAEIKFYNRHYFNIFIPDEVDMLKPLE